MRLLILGILQHGPKHGHEIKRLAELGNVDEWADVQVGALYGMIKRLERESLIEAIRTEREGRRPPRTIYEITREGMMELGVQRENALTSIDLKPTAVDLAIGMAPGADEDELREILNVRRKRVEALNDELIAHRRRDERAGWLPPAGSLGFRHWQLRLEAELQWHDELDEALGDIVAYDGYPQNPGRKEKG